MRNSRSSEIIKKEPEMKRTSPLLTVFTLVILFGCSHSDTRAVERANHAQAAGSEAKILQSWQGDYPVAKLKLLPEKQREKGVGFINNAKTFAVVWKAFKPGEDVPEIVFKANLVLFVRNTQFYNRISISKVNVTNGVAEVLAMETMSAMPIEDKVAISLVAVARKGITAIQVGDKNIQINKKR